MKPLRNLILWSALVLLSVPATAPRLRLPILKYGRRRILRSGTMTPCRKPAYAWSIYLMAGMPYLLLGGLGMGFYVAIRNAKIRARLAPLVFQCAKLQ